MQKPESVFIFGDQLLPDHPLLPEGSQTHRKVVMIESLQRMQSRRYQKPKVVLILAAMRHYADALRKRGFTVDYLEADSFTDGLKRHLETSGSERIHMLEGAEWGARQAQMRLGRELGVEVILHKNTGFLCERYSPPETTGKKLILENFYRAMRRHFKVLLREDGSPEGGAWNFDADNRKPWKGKPLPPPPIGFEPDEITRKAISKVNEVCQENLGNTDHFNLAVTREQALLVLEDFLENRLAHFGAYEDAMSESQPVLFHSVLSPLMNIGLLDPLEIVRGAERAYRENKAPINSVEGFIRQVIGWREYVYWRYHKMMPGFHQLNHWKGTRKLPAFFWNGNTKMNCLSSIIRKVLSTGYSHHIERLMVLCNFALLAGVSPIEVNEWFLVAYIDAYDWVVTPNVIGMGLCADGGQVGTKPYIASAAYINRMGDYCGKCEFDPKKRTGAEACPFNYLYWNFLVHHEAELRRNPRMGPNVLGLSKIKEGERVQLTRAASEFLEGL